MIFVPAWDEVNGALERSWTFDDMAQAARAAQRITALCDEMNHHADLTFGWGHLTVRTTTHDAGNVVTDKDHALAAAWTTSWTAKPRASVSTSSSACTSAQKEHNAPPAPEEVRWN